MRDGYGASKQIQTGCNEALSREHRHTILLRDRGSRLPCAAPNLPLVGQWNRDRTSPIHPMFSPREFFSLLLAHPKEDAPSGLQTLTRERNQFIQMPHRAGCGRIKIELRLETQKVLQAFTTNFHPSHFARSCGLFQEGAFLGYRLQQCHGKRWKSDF